MILSRPIRISFIFSCLCILPLVTHALTEEQINEKRIMVAMRAIGHEVLLSLNDCDSRVLPIEKIEGRFKIPFELNFGFDPGNMVSIIDQVMKETSFATHVLVEVEQCETEAIVHSFELWNDANLGAIACNGRILPEDCYSLLMTILDGTEQHELLLAELTALKISLDTDPPQEAFPGDFSSKEDPKVNLLTSAKSAYFFIPLFILIGFVGFYVRKRNPNQPDDHIISIGGSQFDKRNMSLSFEDQKVELSNKEAELLSLLHTSPNIPIEREVILKRVWGDEGAYVGRTLDVFISKLRKKFEPDTSVKIVNIRGVGYKLVMNGRG